MAGGLGSRVQDFLLEVSKGSVAGHYAVNKFGRNIDIDAAVTADIWDGGHSADESLLWVAPTQARVHQLTSTSASDDGDPVGVGARTVKVWYLPDWDTKETSITVTLNGVGDVALPSCVMINRMQVITKGATNVNVGIITATADTDGTVTSKIQVGKGQTNQAVLGIPSTQKFYLNSIFAYLNKAIGAAGLVDIDLKVNGEPSTELLNFVSKHPWGLQTVGSSGMSHVLPVPKELCGDSDGAIIKIQCLSGTANADLSAGFDGVLVDNTI